jgi:Ca2+-binding EF-hand superfamily protein
MNEEFYRKFTAKQIRECFKRYDKTEKGSMTIDDLRKFMDKIGKHMTQVQLDNLFKELNTENNGEINLDGKIIITKLSLNCEF